MCISLILSGAIKHKMLKCVHMLCAAGPEEVHVRALPAGGGAGGLRQLPGPLLPPGLGTAVEHVRQLWLTRNKMDKTRPFRVY